MNVTLYVLTNLDCVGNAGHTDLSIGATSKYLVAIQTAFISVFALRSSYVFFSHNAPGLSI